MSLMGAVKILVLFSPDLVLVSAQVGTKYFCWVVTLCCCLYEWHGAWRKVERRIENICSCTNSSTFDKKFDLSSSSTLL